MRRLAGIFSQVRSGWDAFATAPSTTEVDAVEGSSVPPAGRVEACAPSDETWAEAVVQDEP